MVDVVSIIAAGITLLYVGIIGYMIVHWRRSGTISEAGQVTVSVVVPVRNDARPLTYLLQDLATQSDTEFELIVVDDHSREELDNITQNALLIRLSEDQAGKKDAIRMAVEQASGELIITTDADCRVPDTWIASIKSIWRSNEPDLLVLPVILEDRDLIGKLDTLDHLSLQGITAGSINGGRPIMASGANMVFTKASYLGLDGFHQKSVMHGDDTLLLQEYVKAGSKVVFENPIEATVRTPSSTRLESFLQQRVRWASKRGVYSTFWPNFIGVTVFSMALAIMALFALGIVFPKLFLLGLLCFGAKALIDFLLLFLVASHFGKTKLLSLYPIAAILYVPYAVFVPILAISAGGTWKDREL